MYPFAASLGVFYFAEENIFSRAIVYIFAFMACLSVYEIGYIWNDRLTMRVESEYVTQRLDPSDASVLKRYYRKIVISKGLVSLLLCLLISLIAMLLRLEISISKFVAALMLMNMTFFVHNHVRSKWSIATFMMLCCLKYIVFVFLFPVISTGGMINLIITEIILIPLLRTIEYSTKRRYRLGFFRTLVGDLDWFRIKYYIIVAGICVVLYSVHQRYVILLLMSSIFMVIFRIATLILSIKLKLRNKDMLGVSIADQQGRP